MVIIEIVINLKVAQIIEYKANVLNYMAEISVYC